MSCGLILHKVLRATNLSIKNGRSLMRAYSDWASKQEERILCTGETLIVCTSLVILVK